MLKINQNYLNLKDSYLFSTVARKVSEYTSKNPGKRVIRMGIGDVTLPLCEAVTEALHTAVDEMSGAETFRGYGPEQGYDFLRAAIRDYYARRGVELGEDEVFVSDGAKSDTGNILDIFSRENTVLIPNPVYPVYLDTNIMDGRQIKFMNAGEHNGFLPLPDESLKADIIYLCSPNNPTGAVYDRESLGKWVAFAKANGSIILFDAAYEAFVSDPNLPRSIFEIEGARECAIEFGSLSKTAGFTGLRCGYVVLPRTVRLQEKELGALWLRRQTTKFNGTAYIIQRAAAAVFSPEGQEQTGRQLAYYRENAGIITQALSELGVWHTGGAHSPYVWLKCPGGMSSWDYFDFLLENANVVGTPGAGFGSGGEGYFRLTAFGEKQATIEAMRRVKETFR